MSVVVPCYNEQATIRLLLDALFHQDYLQNEFEIVIADGLSDDRTRDQIQEFLLMHPEMTVRIVDNPGRTIPAGLNKAIQAARGEFIVRLDAHSVPKPDYISRCVSDLETGRGDIVGGLWEIQARQSTWQARSIALAASHPFGVGDARYRYSDQAGPVDTVPFGAYRKSLIEKIGFYDEDLLTNEDYEFNTRLRESGGIVWFDPLIRSIYFARPDFPALARQYWRYGFWKARMLRKYPNTIRWRQALPPAFVASIVFLLIAAIWLPAARWALLGEIFLYALVIGLAGIQLAIKSRTFKIALGVPCAITTMHFSWGGAFLWSLIH